jgi:hypothetical protein
MGRNRHAIISRGAGPPFTKMLSVSVSEILGGLGGLAVHSIQ